MKKVFNENSFLRDLQEKWNIKDSMILEEIKNNFGAEIEKYSVEHYIKLKQALILKIGTLNEEKKKAYIRCKKLNYEALDNSEAIDYIISIMTGGVLVSFFDKTVRGNNGSILIFILFFAFIILILLKIFLTTTKRYKFVLSILEDIENNM